MTGIVTLEEFNTYSGNFEDSEDVKHLKRQLLDSAKEIVESYLGYSLESDEYREYHTGTNTRFLYLDNRPIEYVNRLAINGFELDRDSYRWDDEKIILLGKIFKYEDDIDVEYSTSLRCLSPLIKTTILRISTLLLLESGENIGLTGKSFDNNSRTFINYTNYDKYLTPLSKCRRFEL